MLTLQRPTYGQFLAQLGEVESWAYRREERAAEIMSQTIPQAPFWSSILDLQPHRMPRTLELADCALNFAMLICMRFKHAFNCPRPSEYSPHIQPLIPVPAHSCFPSGHATESRVFAELMNVLLGLNGNDSYLQLAALSDRIATNRIVAGLHFPIDSEKGHDLGKAINVFFVNHATIDGDHSKSSNTTIGWLWSEARKEAKQFGFV